MIVWLAFEEQVISVESLIPRTLRQTLCKIVTFLLISKTFLSFKKRVLKSLQNQNLVFYWSTLELMEIQGIKWTGHSDSWDLGILSLTYLLSPFVISSYCNVFSICKPAQIRKLFNFFRIQKRLAEGGSI